MIGYIVAAPFDTLRSAFVKDLLAQCGTYAFEYAAQRAVGLYEVGLVFVFAHEAPLHIGSNDEARWLQRNTRQGGFAICIVHDTPGALYSPIQHTALVPTGIPVETPIFDGAFVRNAATGGAIVDLTNARVLMFIDMLRSYHTSANYSKKTVGVCYETPHFAEFTPIDFGASVFNGATIVDIHDPSRETGGKFDHIIHITYPCMEATERWSSRLTECKTIGQVIRAHVIQNADQPTPDALYYDTDTIPLLYVYARGVEFSLSTSIGAAVRASEVRLKASVSA